MDDLKARLRRIFTRIPGTGTRFVNPDGPEAADRIEKLEAALRPFTAMRLSTEPEVSDCLHRSHGALLRLQAERADQFDADIRNARATLSDNGATQEASTPST